MSILSVLGLFLMPPTNFLNILSLGHFWAYLGHFWAYLGHFWVDQKHFRIDRAKVLQDPLLTPKFRKNWKKP